MLQLIFLIGLLLFAVFVCVFVGGGSRRWCLSTSGIVRVVSDDGHPRGGFRRITVRKEGREKEREKKTELVESRSRGTYVNQFVVVALLQIVQHGRVVQVSQIGHVFDFLEFRRIDRMANVFLERLLLRGSRTEPSIRVRFCLELSLNHIEKLAIFCIPIHALHQLY